MSNSIKLLAIDASTDVCSVALCLNDKILNRQQTQPRSHTRFLLPMIESLLAEEKISLQDLDVLACGQGPGSFTGVRIACSMIQAFGFGLHKPIVLVSTLRAMAQGAYRKNNSTKVFVSLNASQQECYWGLFAVDSQGIMGSLQAENVSRKEQIILPAGNWEPVSDPPEAQDIAKIALVEYQLGNIVPAEKVEPVYLKAEFVKKMST